MKKFVNRRKCISLIIALLMLCSCMPSISFAENINEDVKIVSGTCGNNIAWTIDDKGLLTISGNGDMGSFDSSYSPDKIKKVMIEDGITSIADFAFEGCSNLTSISIPDSVSTFGNGAFRYCSSLTSISIPDSVIALGNYAFSGCSNLTSITIPDGIINIGDSMFSGCISLKTIMIPESVKYFGDYVFIGCSGLTNVRIPEGVTSIGTNMFGGCSSLTSITIPDSVITLGNYAFSGCSDLTSITIPKNVTSIGSSTFSKCTGLSTIIIPNNVSTIDGYAFDLCSNLTSITIPDSVTDIGEYAFRGCNKLNIYGNAGSYAHDYAKNNNKPFVCLSHKNVKKLPAAAPSCLKEGLTEGEQCNDCGTIIISQDIIETLDHTEVIDKPVAATCTTPGLTAGKHCSVCGEVLEAQTEVTALNHTEKKLPAVSPDCTKAGLTEGVKCSLCGEVFIPQEVVAATGHDYVSEVTKSASCNEVGVITYACVCGDTYTEEIPLLPHSEVIDEATDPTATNPGLTEGKHCSVCGKVLVKQQLVPNKEISEHREQLMSKLDENADENGKFNIGSISTTGYECVIYIEDNMLVITYKTNSSNWSGHYETLKIVYYFDDENVHVNYSGPSDNFNYKASAVFKANEFTKGKNIDFQYYGTGYGGMSITYAKNFADDAFPVINKAINNHLGISLLNIGFTSYEHTYGDWIIDCAAGSKYKVCRLCGDKVTEKISVTGHTTNNGECKNCKNYIVEKNARLHLEYKTTNNHQMSWYHDAGSNLVCENTSNGFGYSSYMYYYTYADIYFVKTGTYNLYVKSSSGLTLKHYPIIVIEHSHDYVKTIKEATCEAEGYTTYSCACGDTYVTDKVEATGHKPGVVATCTTAQTCTVCNVELEAVKGHKPGVVATCTTAQTCIVCNSELVPAKGHMPSATATCTTAQTCSVCNVELEAAKGHKPGGAATCTTAQTCTVCNSELVPAKGHILTEEAILTKTATHNGEDGTLSYKCERCNEFADSKDIPYIAEVGLSKTAYSYNGKSKTPSVIIKDRTGKQLVENRDYTLGSWKCTTGSSAVTRKAIGEYYRTVKFIGNYSGSEKLYFTIGPKKVKSYKATLSSYNKVKLTHSKASGATSCWVSYKKSGSEDYQLEWIVTPKPYTLKTGKLASGTKYYFQITPVKTIKGKWCFGESTTCSIYTLKKVDGVNVTKTGAKVKVSWENIAGESGYQISQSTSKTKTKIVATYSTSSGKSKVLKATKNKKYYYKVRAYKKVGKTKIYGPWSKVKAYKR